MTSTTERLTVHLKIERDGVVLYDGDVTTLEYAEKADGTVSLVGRTTAQEERPTSNVGDLFRSLGQKVVESQRAKTAALAAEAEAALQTEEWIAQNGAPTDDAVQ